MHLSDAKPCEYPGRTPADNSVCNDRPCETIGESLDQLEERDNTTLL